MDEKKLYSKLDKISEDIGNVKDSVNKINITQAVHTEQLSEHMRRTALLETAQVEHESEDVAALEKIDKKLEPVEQFLGSLKGIKYLIWFIGAVLGILVAVSKIL